LLKIFSARFARLFLASYAANPNWAEMLITNLSGLLAKSIEQHILALEKVKALRTEVERLTAAAASRTYS
jgi:hypothetical protein